MCSNIKEQERPTAKGLNLVQLMYAQCYKLSPPFPFPLGGINIDEAGALLFCLSDKLCGATLSHPMKSATGAGSN